MLQREWPPVQTFLIERISKMAHFVRLGPLLRERLRQRCNMKEALDHMRIIELDVTELRFDFDQ